MWRMDVVRADSAGKMTAKGIIAKKKNSSAWHCNNRDIEISWSCWVFHYQQDTWAHRHHYGTGPCQTESEPPVVWRVHHYNNTPNGPCERRAYAGPCAFFDPVCAPALPVRRIAICDQVLQQTGLTVSPFLPGYQPSLENWTKSEG